MEPKVSFTLGQGGSGRSLTTFDHYSAMVAYYSAGSANSAYAGIGDKIYTSIVDAENDGITFSFSDATAATSSQTVTTAGTNGDIITITFLSWDGTTITLGTYTKVTGDNTVTLVATAIVAAINANTYLTGFSASVGSSGAYTITAPKSFGTYPNTKLVVNTFSASATMAVTNVAFANGTVSPLAQIHYQISEAFRGNPDLVLYFSLKWDDSGQLGTAFNAQMQTDGLSVGNAFQGQARQYLFYNPFRTFATSSLTSLKALRNTLLAQYTPGVMLYYAAYTGSLSSQANTRALTNGGVSAIIGTSGSGVGRQLQLTQQTNIGEAGICLGTLSLSKVSQSIGEVGAFNISDGSECEVAALFDGTDYQSISQSLANQLHDYGYIYGKKFKGGFPGTYFNFGNCAESPASDYANIEDNRTIDKAIRNTYLSILPLLNSKNLVNPNGTLAAASIAGYNEKVDAALASMVRDTDLNDYSVQVSTTAVVTSTKTVPITIKLQQTPISEFISITIGFSATI